MNLKIQAIFPLLLAAGFAAAPSPVDGEVSVPLEKPAEEEASLVWVADLLAAEEGTLLEGASAGRLAPGRYRLHVPLAMTPVEGLAVAGVRIRMRAGSATREASVLAFSRPGETAVMALDFTVNRAQQVPVAVAWSIDGRLGARARERAAAQGAKEADLGPGALEADPFGEDAAMFAGPMRDPEGRVALKVARGIEPRLVARQPWIEPRVPVGLSVETDRVHYRPGQAATASLVLRNHAERRVTGRLALGLAWGLDAKRRLEERELRLEAGAARRIRVPVPLEGVRWGAALTARFTGASGRTQREAIFAVHENPWAVAMIAARPRTLDGPGEPSAARAEARRLRDAGYTGFEAFFWAPCDLFEFTPESERFYGGQGGYPATRAGTRATIEAMHEMGMIATVYANLWGGSGPVAMEVMRRHPDWFGGANFEAEVLADWLYLGEVVPAPGLPWAFTNLRLDPPEAAFRRHAEELVASRAEYGWDAVRYDSYYTQDWTLGATHLVRRVAGAKAPGLRFGYNSHVENEAGAGSLPLMLAGGELVMEEALRHVDRWEGDLDRYTRQLSRMRDQTWAHGGHLAVVHDEPIASDTLREALPLDRIYLASAILACGAHPYYGALPRTPVDFPAFALRHARAIWDPRMRPVAGAGLRLPSEPALLAPARFLRSGPLSEGRHRAVLHLLPVDPGYRLTRTHAMTRPTPHEAMPVELRLPQEAVVEGAWVLEPGAPAASRPVSHEPAGAGFVRFTLGAPDRYRVLVVRWQGPDLAHPPDAAEVQASHPSAWRIAGPFHVEGAREPQALLAAPLPPEAEPGRFDPGARWPGAGQAPLRWRAPPRPPAPETGRTWVAPHEQGFSRTVHFAAIQVHSDRSRTLQLRGGADDGWKIYVNGRPVHSSAKSRPRIDHAQVAIELEAGRNLVLVKVANRWMGSSFFLRLAEPDGAPAKGVRFTEPEAFP